MYISTFVLAERLNLDTMLVRKDLAMVGVPGRPRRGYPAKELQHAINRVLGWDSATDAVLVGVGSLGSALLGYSGFEEQNLSIVVAFDSAQRRFGAKIHGVKVRPMEDLPRLVKRLKVKLAILTVPNASVWGSAITNFSALGKRRVDTVVAVAYGTDLTKAVSVARAALEKVPGVLANPAPAVAVGSLGESAVTINVRPWAACADYWAVFSGAQQAVKEAFERAGIKIPFPQIDVHMAS